MGKLRWPAGRTDTPVLGSRQELAEPHSTCPWRVESASPAYKYRIEATRSQAEPRQPEAVALRRALPSVNPHIGRLLKRLRGDRGMSQSKLANAVGVDTSYISKLEGGHVHSPSPAVIERLGEVLGMDSEILFSFCGTVSPRLENSLSNNPQALRFTRAVLDADLSDLEWQEMFACLARMRNNGM